MKSLLTRDQEFKVVKLKSSLFKQISYRHHELVGFFLLIHEQHDGCHMRNVKCLLFWGPGFAFRLRFQMGFKLPSVVIYEAFQVLFYSFDHFLLLKWVVFLCPTYDSRGALCFLVCASVRSSVRLCVRLASG